MPEDQNDETTPEMGEALRHNQGRRLSIAALGLVVVFLGPLVVRRVFHDSTAATIVQFALLIIFLCLIVPMTYRWFRGMLRVNDPYLNRDKRQK